MCSPAVPEQIVEDEQASKMAPFRALDVVRLQKYSSLEQFLDLLSRLAFNTIALLKPVHISVLSLLK